MTSEHNIKFTHIIYIYAVYRMTEHIMTIYEMTEGSDLTLSRGGALVFILFIYFFLLMHPGRGPGARAVCVTPVAQDPTCTL